MQRMEVIVTGTKKSGGGGGVRVDGVRVDGVGGSGWIRTEE